MTSARTTETPRLAAILAIDVVGYSRLMRDDEMETLSTLKAVRSDVIDPIVAQFRGRLFKAMGDGFLLEFGSVANAVQCAMAIQEDMLARNASRAGGQTLEFRMGLNVADIIPDQDDVLGDGVNIAARLESLAEPSGLCISGAVYEQIRHTYGDAFRRLGPRVLKNIETPIEVYAVNFANRRPAPLLARLDRIRWAHKPRLLIAAALVLLAAGAGGAAVIGFGSRLPGGSGAATVNADRGTMPDANAAPGEKPTEAQEIDASAQSEVARAKAQASVATAKAEADAATAEAEARAQALKRAVDAWKEASIALTEAAEGLRKAETRLAEIKARVEAAEGSRPDKTGPAETARPLDALQRRVGSAEEALGIAQARYDTAVTAEQVARAHMEKLKADAPSAEPSE